MTGPARPGPVHTLSVVNDAEPPGAPAPLIEVHPTRSTRLARLGAAAGRHPGRFVAAWVVLVVVCFALALGTFTGQSLFDRLHSGSPEAPGEAQTGQQLLDAHDPSGTSVMLQVHDAPLDDPAALAAARTATDRVAQVPGVARVQSPLLLPQGVDDPAARPLLAGGSTASRGFLTVVDLDPGLSDSAESAAEDRVRAGLTSVVAALPGATGQVGGVNQLVLAITSQVESDLRAGEGIALPLSFVVMFFVFGGFIAAGMPIAGAVASIGGALAALFGFSHLMDLDATVVNVVTLLGLGLAIDYGLLTVSRFREELGRIAAADTDHRRHVPTREDVVAATSHTVATAGRTVLFSGLTVAIAISGLLLFDVSIMRAIGAAGVSVVLVAVLVDLTLLPALCALGARRLARSPRARAPETHDQGAFSRLARAVQGRPWTVIAGTVAVLVALSLPVFGMRLTSSGERMLPVSAPQRVFFETLDRDYPALATPAATVVARTSLESVSAWATSSVATLPHVTAVEPRDLGGGYAAVSVTLDGPALGDRADALVHSLRAQRPGFPTWVTGQQAFQVDFLAGMAQRAPYAVLLVVVATFVLLFLMTGSVIIPIKALILNVMSLGAALGVLVWVFQDGHLAGLVHFDSVGAVESMIPFLVLAFGFGLSMDYEVFLLSRIAELYRSGVPNDQSVALGLQRSGRIITSAALLICIVFAGFAAGQLLVIKEIGVALVTAVVIDATLVRMLLVPATMTILGEWNWWAPAPLRRWHTRFGLTD